MIQLQLRSQPYFLVFFSTVLHVRGETACKQPLVSHVTGNVLLFNGEVYHLREGEGDDQSPNNYLHEEDNDVNGEEGCLRTQNDTQLLFERLENPDNGKEGNEDLLTLISRIKGPFSMVYFSKERRELWIGKDCLGRRSLCFQTNGKDGSPFTISSVCDPEDGDWCEFPPNGIYCIKLDQVGGGETMFPISLYEWDRSLTSDDAHAHDIPFKHKHDRVKGRLQSPITCSLNKVIYSLKHPQSLEDKSCNQPAVPSSGPVTNAIVREVDAVEQLERVLDLSVKRRIQLFHQLCDSCCRLKNKARNHLSDEHEMMDESRTDAPISRVNKKNDTQITKSSCDHASVAVLFSGGIDCTVIALIADRYVPAQQPIDLINVSFAPGSPDRMTSLAGHAELSSLRPNRVFNLVYVDVDKPELISVRHELIWKLIYPSASVLDDSTGCAFFFASRGEGYLIDQRTGQHVSYASPARVLLNGLGSDEQMAGYARHRRLFHLDGFDALNEEICREVDQLHLRNLGRDDRIVSHHGKEVRYPFLDEDVVSFLNSLPIQSKCDLTLERGVGEKRLLRQLATSLGLIITALREKRAIQFGSRIAKLEDRKEKGDMTCERLLLVASSPNRAV